MKDEIALFVGVLMIAGMMVIITYIALEGGR